MDSLKKVYFFHDEENRGFYFGADTYKSAKNMALRTNIKDGMSNPYIEIKGRLIKGCKTDKIGVLNIRDLSDIGLLWWNCKKCESENVLVSEESERIGKYNCEKCGHCGEIPID